MANEHRVHWYRQHTFGAVRWRCDICGDEESDVFAAGWNMALREVLPAALLEKLQAGESIDEELKKEHPTGPEPVEADATA